MKSFIYNAHKVPLLEQYGIFNFSCRISGPGSFFGEETVNLGILENNEFLYAWDELHEVIQRREMRKSLYIFLHGSFYPKFIV